MNDRKAVRLLDAGDSVTLKVNVGSAGAYTLSLRYSQPYDENGKIQNILVNGKRTGTVSFGYTDSGKFNFWLSRIAHNVIMDTYRHQKNSHIVEPTEDNDLNKLRSNDLMDINRENEYVNSQVMNDVRHLMDSLPTAQREVVYMRYYQDLSFKEIAEITGVSINTSLGRMLYALINMRRMAKEHHIQLNMEL